MSQNKLLILDGDQMMFRYHPTMSKEVIQDDLELGAVQGILFGLQKSFEFHNATHLIVIFDEGKNTFRHKMFPDYKGQRPPRPESMIYQKNILRANLNRCGITQFSHPDFEGDDGIGSIATNASKMGWKVLVEAIDKDFFFLVEDPNIRIWDPRGKREIDREYIFKKTNGLEPHMVQDWLALMGDAADNVPGLHKVGEITAGKFLQGKKSLEDLLSDMSHLPEKHRKELHNNRQKFIWFRDLMKIRLDVPVPNPEICTFKKFRVYDIMKDLIIPKFTKEEPIENIQTKKTTEESSSNGDDSILEDTLDEIAF